MLLLLDNIERAFIRFRAWVANLDRGLPHAIWKFLLGATGGIVTVAFFVAFTAELVLLVTLAPGTALLAASVGGAFGLLRPARPKFHPRPPMTPYPHVWERRF